jgi:UDP-3-O-[3-hydroxymyristoyl] glucosamine N-acyltransferase
MANRKPTPKSQREISISQQEPYQQGGPGFQPVGNPNDSELNRGNQIGHDSIIGDYFSAMPGAIISGNVILGENVYMGTNSSIREKIQVCSNVTIGSNATVVKNIITGGTYVGVPGKFKKN